MEHRTALVLGAHGGIGSEVARQLLAAGWQVRGMSRRAPGQDRMDGIDYIRGDAMLAADVLDAARGCAVIVHAVNPAGYRNWAGQVVPMLRNTIAAAEAVNALVLLPGTVYNYGADAFPVMAADAPQHPATHKGRLRVQMEDELQAFAQRGGRVLIVRAGDYFGPQAGSNWFSQGLVKPGQAPARIAYPGRPGIGHQWGYLPDIAATMVALLDRREMLPAFARFNMAGHWDADGTAMTGAIVRAAAQRGIAARVVGFPWWLMRLAAPFNETMREIAAVRYLWTQPARLSNAELLAVLGTEPHTPLDEAVERTLVGLECLAARA
jgi:nucleoside-diphosphate-sugar epimerase